MLIFFPKLSKIACMHCGLKIQKYNIESLEMKIPIYVNVIPTMIP